MDTYDALHCEPQSYLFFPPLLRTPDRLRLSPLATDHITLTGQYRIALAEALRDHSAYRELNTRPALAA